MVLSIVYMTKSIFIALSLFVSFTSIAQVATWNDNVSCILSSHCASCHNTNGIGPADFTSFAVASTYKMSIKDAVLNKRMPPYPANTGYQHYTHERLLTQQEVDILTTWADNGAPQGTGALPAVPTFPAGTVMIAPDKVAMMPSYTVNTTGGDEYRCFVIPSGLTSDKFITNIEVVPGNRQIVHHVLVFTDTSNVPAILDAADPAPGYVSGGTGSNASTLLMGWVPGQGIIDMPSGFGLRAANNCSYILQIHYPAGVNNMVDSTKVYLKYASTPQRLAYVSPILNHGSALQNGPLAIAANTTKTFVAKYTVPTGLKTTILSVSPHMHKVGRSIRSFAVAPTNDTVAFIDIPNWDFNWQGSYQFRQPLIVPGGSTMWASAFYDNTSANPFNPNNPPQLVVKGEATNDEMLLVYFTFALYQAGDENIIMDSASHGGHFSGCAIGTVPAAITNNAHQPMPLNIFPNPSNGSFTFDNNMTTSGTIAIFTTTGQKVYEQLVSPGRSTITANLKPGLYQVCMRGSNGNLAREVVQVY
jgi:hypothetical protein